MGDLFAAARPQAAPPAPPPAVTLRAALARTVAHMEALTYTRRAAEGSRDGAWWPDDDWLRAFAMGPRGRDETDRLGRALRRLSPAERQVLAEELLR